MTSSEPGSFNALQMRRTPQQKRSRDVIEQIEQATVALLTEQGFGALNTNAIADKAGIGIKSLYHFFPNKEAIIFRLADRWLHAVRDVQQRIAAQELDMATTLRELDLALTALDQEFSGYGALWQAMELIPQLAEMEAQHELAQIEFWSTLLRRFNCRWPDEELKALVMYFYRTTDVAKQVTKINGTFGQPLWQFHTHMMLQLFELAIKNKSADVLLK